MEINRALDQISEIHDHLAKAEVYRGQRALPVAASGVLALIAAAMQGRIIGEESGRAFVAYWATVAVVGGATAVGGSLYAYLFLSGVVERRRTRTVVGQFVPCALAGIVVTAAIGFGADARGAAWLPGLWAILFSLGIFAMRPYLPKMIGWAALFYFAAGAGMLAMARAGAGLWPWGMGLTFGAGQILCAVILYWNLERQTSA
jgi:hypothetical protein